MQDALAILIGLMLSAAIFLVLSRSLIRILTGLVLLGNGVNLLILDAGRLTRATPPIVPEGLSVPVQPIANPLPQALILTAIVIGFALFGFLLVLVMRAREAIGADMTDEIRLAEPADRAGPPMSY
jgi:multicomponent Na+:H+ antiporter subunit C